MRETQTGDCPSFRRKQEHITEEGKKKGGEIRFTGPQTHGSLNCVSESCQMCWKQPLLLLLLLLSAQCHKSLARGDLRGKTYETCIPDSLPNWLLIQTDVVFFFLLFFFSSSSSLLMKCNWRAARLHSKLKRERDSLRARPTWFERAYLSLAPVILTTQIA